MHKKFHIQVGFSCSDNPKSKFANPKWVGGFALVIAFVGLAGGAGSQPAKIPRIGFLSCRLPFRVSARVEAFRQGCASLAIVEGANNIVIEWRYGEGNLDRLPALAAELARLKVDIIVSAGPTVTRPAKEATSSIPIVMAS